MPVAVAVLTMIPLPRPRITFSTSANVVGHLVGTGHVRDDRPRAKLSLDAAPVTITTLFSKRVMAELPCRSGGERHAASSPRKVLLIKAGHGRNRRAIPELLH